MPTPTPPQALHLEDNDLPGLPPAPCLPGLRMLLLDWGTALDSAAALAAATRLTRCGGTQPRRRRRGVRAVAGWLCVQWLACQARRPSLPGQ